MRRAAAAFAAAIVGCVALPALANEKGLSRDRPSFLALHES
jgi:hypothetical protein